MSNETDVPTPPEDLSSDLATSLRGADTHDLREAIVYAQELLWARQEPTMDMELNEGEELVRINEHDGYTVVVKRQPCSEECSECPHGPYVYRVTRERHLDGQEHLQWTFLGRTATDDT